MDSSLPPSGRPLSDAFRGLPPGSLAPGLAEAVSKFAVGKDFGKVAGAQLGALRAMAAQYEMAKGLGALSADATKIKALESQIGKMVSFPKIAVESPRHQDYVPPPRSMASIVGPSAAMETAKHTRDIADGLGEALAALRAADERAEQRERDVEAREREADRREQERHRSNVKVAIWGGIGCTVLGVALSTLAQALLG